MCTSRPVHRNWPARLVRLHLANQNIPTKIPFNNSKRRLRMMSSMSRTASSRIKSPSMYHRRDWMRPLHGSQAGRYSCRSFSRARKWILSYASEECSPKERRPLTGGREGGSCSWYRVTNSLKSCESYFCHLITRILLRNFSIPQILSTLSNGVQESHKWPNLRGHPKRGSIHSLCANAIDRTGYLTSPFATGSTIRSNAIRR